MLVMLFYCFFFFNDTATTEIYTLSLHDALPIWRCGCARENYKPRRERDDHGFRQPPVPDRGIRQGEYLEDRKSTRLNSSHRTISYAVFCLKKKKKNKKNIKNQTNYK